MGRPPMAVYAPEGRDIEAVDDEVLRKALIVTETRKVRRDTTVSVVELCDDTNRNRVWPASRPVG